MTPLPHVDSMPRKVTTKVHTSLSVDRKACARVLCPPSRSGAAGRVKTADFAKTREEQTVTREFESKERPSGHEVASFARRRRLLATKSRVLLEGEDFWPRSREFRSKENTCGRELPRLSPFSNVEGGAREPVTCFPLQPATRRGQALTIGLGQVDGRCGQVDPPERTLDWQWEFGCAT